MKKIAFYLILIAVIGSSCNGDLVSYDFERSGTLLIRAGAPSNAVQNYMIENLSTDYEDVAATNGQTPDNTADLYMRFCAMELISPLSRSLNFLQRGEIFANAPGRPEIKVAELETTPSNIGQYIEFVPTTEPLVNHFQADSYSLRLELVFDELVTQDMQVRILQGFRVLAEP